MLPEAHYDSGALPGGVGQEHLDGRGSPLLQRLENEEKSIEINGVSHEMSHEMSCLRLEDRLLQLSRYQEHQLDSVDCRPHVIFPRNGRLLDDLVPRMSASQVSGVLPRRCPSCHPSPVGRNSHRRASIGDLRPKGLGTSLPTVRTYPQTMYAYV